MSTPSEPSPEICNNCERRLAGRYCGACGQARTRRLTVGSIGQELKDQVLGLDFRLLRTIRAVLGSPGRLVDDYLEGRRIPYTNPIKLLFFTATVYLLTVTLLDIQVSSNPGTQETARSIVAIMNYLVYLLLLPVAALLRLLFRSRINLAESYVLLCFLWSGYLLLATGLAVVIVPIDDYYLPARSGLGVAYLTFGFRGYFRIGWREALLKALVLFVGYFVFTVILMTILLVIAYLVGIQELAIPALQRP